ncbi:MAG: hypothetical protein E7273_12335 [Pseudobutyrivibrio ruminis]|nr:hypothetical protein [Pseudobutyrivibrio ruminis]
MSYDETFSGYQSQLRDIQEAVDLGIDEGYEMLAAFRNTITGLETTRFAGDSTLLELGKEIKELGE